MDLNQFSTVDIVLDKANDNFIQKQTISAGDRDGRSLTLQVTDAGSIGEVPGLTANLLWTNHSSGVSDLSAFSVVDRTTSVFKIDYPQNMLTAGKVTAQIQLLHNGKVTHSKKFEIIVLDIAGKLKGVLQTAEYTALVEALAKTNGFETDIAEVTAQLAQNAKQMTTVRNNNLSALVTTDGKNIVVTGDSLSFNSYDFLGGASNAWEAWPGILSWSFMLRDAIYLNDPCFKFIEEVPYNVKNGTITKAYNNGGDYNYAFNGRFTNINTDTPATEYIFKYKTNKANPKIILYGFTYPNTGNCTFDVYVNGVLKATVDNATADTTTWHGFQTILTEITDGFTAGDEVEIKLTNFVPHSGTTARVYLQGIGTIKRNINITGRGSWYSSQILADIDNRILQYNPDLLMLIVGANDLFNNVPVAQFRNNVENIITQTRKLKPKCEIMLLTPPYMDLDMEMHQTFNTALKELAIQYHCFYVDLVEMFRNSDPSEWRFDNVHMNKLGNTVLARNLINIIMPDGHYDFTMIDSKKTFTNGKRFSEPKQIFKGSMNATWNGTAFTQTYYLNSDKVITTVAKKDANQLRITFDLLPDDNLTSPPIIQQFGTFTKVFMVKPYTFNQVSKVFDYYIVKFDSTTGDWITISEADWTTYASSMKFLITY